MENMAQTATPLQFIVNTNHAGFLAPDDMGSAIIDYCRQSGQGDITDASVLLRCVYDSLALCFRMKLEQMQQLVGERYQCLNIVGGGTKDRMLMQLSADCLGIPVVAGPVEATAIGNIIGQAIAEGTLAGLEVGRDLVKNSFELDEYIPNKKDKAAWDDALQKFSELP